MGRKQQGWAKSKQVPEPDLQNVLRHINYSLPLVLDNYLRRLNRQGMRTARTGITTHLENESEAQASPEHGQTWRFPESRVGASGPFCSANAGWRLAACSRFGGVAGISRGDLVTAANPSVPAARRRHRVIGFPQPARAKLTPTQFRSASSKEPGNRPRGLAQ